MVHESDDSGDTGDEDIMANAPPMPEGLLDLDLSEPAEDTTPAVVEPQHPVSTPPAPPAVDSSAKPIPADKPSGDGNAGGWDDEASILSQIFAPHFEFTEWCSHSLSNFWGYRVRGSSLGDTIAYKEFRRAELLKELALKKAALQELLWL